MAEKLIDTTDTSTTTSAVARARELFATKPSITDLLGAGFTQAEMIAVLTDFELNPPAADIYGPKGFNPWVSQYPNADAVPFKEGRELFDIGNVAGAPNNPSPLATGMDIDRYKTGDMYSVKRTNFTLRVFRHRPSLREVASAIGHDVNCVCTRCTERIFENGQPVIERMGEDGRPVYKTTKACVWHKAAFQTILDAMNFFAAAYEMHVERGTVKRPNWRDYPDLVAYDKATPRPTATEAPTVTEELEAETVA